MKTKFVRNGKTNRRELLIALQRGETLAVKLADLLAGDSSTMLLEFAYEKQRGGTTLLHYDVDGLWSLRTYLSKRRLGVEEVMGLLEATQAVLDLCAERQLRAEGLIFDVEFVFVDAQCRPHFALVPLEDAPFEARNSPLALLSALCDTGRLRFSSPDAEGLAKRLGGIVLDFEGVFSANQYRRFLEEERSQGDGGAPEARRSVVEPGTSSVWASVGGAGERPEADSGALFWSPLAGFAEEEPQVAVAEAAAAPAAVPEPVSDVPQWLEPVAAEPERAPVATAGAKGVAPNAPSQLAQEVSVPAVPVAAVPVAAAMQPVRPQVAPAATWLIRPATGERFSLPQGQQVRVGRGSACDIRLLGNRKLSRMHAAITVAGPSVMVSDLGAANGIFVDGVRVPPMQSQLMTPGQRLRLADEEFEVRNA